MFARDLGDQILMASVAFYALAVVGPRQSGKTTLLKFLFPDYRYVNLEDPDTLQIIKADPRGFFSNISTRWIIDEAQEYPELFSYLLGFIDNNKLKGQFILSGSKNFLLLEKISQSLAGRIAIFELLPLTYKELATSGDFVQRSIWHLIYGGSYPGPHHDNIATELWYKSYVTTYLQRDVRQLIRVKDLSKLHLFLKLCAVRHGQLINLTEIGIACGISHTTVSEWINLLELSYILFRVQPYYKNFNKRLVKNQKLYFYDSGLVCHLLGIESADHTQIHASRGAVFEGYIISERIKYFVAQAKTPNVYFWSSHKGFEVDLLIEKSEQIHAIEIKSSATYSHGFIKQLTKWQALNPEQNINQNYLVYAGSKNLTVNNIQVISYENIYKNIIDVI